MQTLKKKKESSLHELIILWYAKNKDKIQRVSLTGVELMLVKQALFIVCMMHQNAHSFVSLHCMADQKFIPPPSKGFFMPNVLCS